MELDRSDRISAPMTPPNRNPAVPPRTTPALIAPDRASSAVQLSKHNLVVDPIAPPMRAPPSRPMPAPAQKWPRVPSPLERRVTDVVGMTNPALLDGARISALWAAPRLGARSSGRTTSRFRPKDMCASFPIGSETEQPRRREQENRPSDCALSRFHDLLPRGMGDETEGASRINTSEGFQYAPGPVACKGGSPYSLGVSSSRNGP